MLRSRFCLNVLAVIFLGLSSCPGQESTRSDPGVGVTTDPSGDMLCGSRCAQYILKCYGLNIELTDIIAECQFPDLEAGASLERISATLRNRGIHTSAVRSSEPTLPDWGEPVLLHLLTEQGIGHFVVLLPRDGEDVKVWAGLQGVRRGTPERLLARCSGTMLLTSSRPIVNVAKIRPRSLVPSQLNLGTLAPCAALLILFAWAARSFRAARSILKDATL